MSRPGTAYCYCLAEWHCLPVGVWQLRCIWTWITLHGVRWWHRLMSCCGCRGSGWPEIALVTIATVSQALHTAMGFARVGVCCTARYNMRLAGCGCNFEKPLTWL